MNTSNNNNYVNSIIQTEHNSNTTQIEQNSNEVSIVNSDEDITTDYNNSENNILQSSDESIINSENQQINDPYAQLFIDNPDNPFYKCKINKLDYDTDNEETDEYIRTIVTWNYEFNYDFFNILQIKCFISKNSEFVNILHDVKKYRDDNNTTTTGLLLKLENNGLKLSDLVHTYLIVYYDNAKCNIEIYGIFDQELEENKLLKNIIDESIYGKTGKIISNTNINSTGGEGFLVIHNLVYIE